MNILRRILIWISRMPHSRGFGVQSPSAYRFIRYVVSEHYPYYAYDDLRKKYPHLDWLTRKRMEFYFRLANFCQADRFLDFCPDDSLQDVLADYVAHGCRKTRMVGMAPGKVEGSRGCPLRICPGEGAQEILAEAMAQADMRTVAVIEDIRMNGQAKRMWQMLVASDVVSVSYDLYYIGVAFFDTDRHKADYIVNF